MLARRLDCRQQAEVRSSDDEEFRVGHQFRSQASAGGDCPARVFLPCDAEVSRPARFAVHSDIVIAGADQRQFGNGSAQWQLLSRRIVADFRGRLGALAASLDAAFLRAGRRGRRADRVVAIGQLRRGSVFSRNRAHRLPRRRVHNHIRLARIVVSFVPLWFQIRPRRHEEHDVRDRLLRQQIEQQEFGGSARDDFQTALGSHGGAVTRH